MSPLLSLPTFFSSLSICSPRIEKIKDGTWHSNSAQIVNVPSSSIRVYKLPKKYNIIIISTLLVVFLPLFVTVHFCAKQRTRAEMLCSSSPSCCCCSQLLCCCFIFCYHRYFFLVYYQLCTYYYCLSFALPLLLVINDCRRFNNCRSLSLSLFQIK